MKLTLKRLSKSPFSYSVRRARKELRQLDFEQAIHWDLTARGTARTQRVVGKRWLKALLADMEYASRLNEDLPLNIFIAVLQFAVPEIMSTSEARLVSKVTLLALARTRFWRGITIDLNRDEGDANFPSQSSCGGTVGDLSDNDRRRSPGGAVVGLRSNAGSNLRGLIGTKTQGHKDDRDVGARKDVGGVCGGDGGGSSSSSKKRSWEPVGGGGSVGTDKGGEERGDVRHRAVVGSGSRFLRRYHHHVAFRRLAPPVMDTYAVDMPMSLHPTCMDACGAMVAIGTRQGPVIVFHVGPAERSSKATDPPSQQTRGENPQRDSSGSIFPPKVGRDGGDGGSEDRVTVYRAYGSSSKGEGPISSVVLDRSKLLAAGRCFGIGGGIGRPVIRMYDVDSTRLLRTLQCMDEVSRICLFDPVLAVQYPSLGCLSFRDIYAEGSTGLGQQRTGRFLVAGFAVVEVQQPLSGTDDKDDCRGRDGIVLHCTDASGTMFEASTCCETWNKEQSYVYLGGSRVFQPWHVHADMEAMLLIQVSPWGIVRGWRLRSNGGRINGPIFVFGMDPSSSSSSSAGLSPAIGVPRRVASVNLGAGGTILATALVGAAPRLWDVRLARRSRMGRKTVGVPTGGASMESAVAHSLGRASRAEDVVVDGGRMWGLASLDTRRRSVEVKVQGSTDALGDEDRIDREGGARDGQTRPRWAGVRPWPTGVWAVGVIVDTSRGRVVSACSDRRVRVTRLRPNNREQRLRTALLRSRREAKVKTVSG